MNRHIHFIGIGGIGMSGIAQLFISQGAKVSGSDLKENQVTRALKRLGADVFVGHDPANIAGADLVVYSSAIKDDNPEFMQAKRQGLPLIKRAQALAMLMKDKTVITVTGSHGKTTTTSLISCLLTEAGLCPSVAIGGILRNIDSNACVGEGKFFVAEADESDGSFLYYQPKYSIITNIDQEHLDYYGDLRNEIAAFKKFINQTEPQGCVFCCSDDPNLKGILKDYRNKFMLFGLHDDAHIYPKNITMEGLSSEFDCFYMHKNIGRFYLALGGEHNISNALAVIALGLELGIDLAVIKKILASYKGAKRRLEIRFSSPDYLVIDDYAHHPTEIKATLSAVKNIKKNRVIAVFQPHRFSRTKLLLNEFGKSFDLADCIIVTDIYPAGEPPIEGVNGYNVFKKIKASCAGKYVVFLPKEQIPAHLAQIIQPQDLVIILGAGDIVNICDELVEKIKRQN
jgi:UDP-N-acetylmuramate--alanine ligase